MMLVLIRLAIGICAAFSVALVLSSKVICSRELHEAFVGVVESTARDNLHDLQTIARGELALREIGRGDGFAIQLHDDAARGQALRGEEAFQGAGQGGCNFVTIGDDGGLAHGVARVQAALRTVKMLRSTAVSRN